MQLHIPHFAVRPTSMNPIGGGGGALNGWMSVEWQKVSSFEFKRAYSVLNGELCGCVCCVCVSECVEFFSLWVG